MHRVGFRVSAVLSFAIAGLITAVPAAQAQDVPVRTSLGFESRSRLITVGGMGGGGYDGSGLGGAVEFGVGRLGRAPLSLGVFGGFQRQSREIGTLEVATTAIPLMATTNLHLPLAARQRTDLYAGVSAGLTHVTVSSNSALVGDDDDRGTYRAFGVQVGARYRLLPRLGLVGQLGFGDLPRFLGGASFVL